MKITKKTIRGMLLVLNKFYPKLGNLEDSSSQDKLDYFIAEINDIPINKQKGVKGRFYFNGNMIKFKKYKK